MVIEHLVNPTRLEMEALHQLGSSDLRALVSDTDDLYVWDMDAGCHDTFANSLNLQVKAWLYINPVQQTVRVSTFSHAGDNYEEVEEGLKKLARLRSFTVAPIKP
jgi:hypothetical protein